MSNCWFIVRNEAPQPGEPLRGLTVKVAALLNLCFDFWGHYNCKRLAKNLTRW
ncbi:hypothetical protein B0813_002935 [Candidatus Fervidibacteria bacterium JGI MDM2 SSWTFF-3-K9]